MTAAGSGDDLAIRAEGLQLTRDQLDDDIFGFRAQVPSGGIAVSHTDDAVVVAAAFFALDGWAAEVHLVPPDVAEPPALAAATRLRTTETDGPTIEATTERPTRWVLYTSGTTGQPKRITHSRTSLMRTVVPGAFSALVWGLLYDPNRMAGLQVILQALHGGGSLVAAPPNRPLSERIEFLVGSGVTALSATPTVWRQILQLPRARGWGLEQITLGGEIADQSILNALDHAFPSARIVHVFASTETGAAFSVKDRREGFPRTYLSDPPRGIQLAIRDDVLHVYSPGVSAAASDGFASTGDIVEVVDDRVLFRGRATGMVNIGGSNVAPEAVEAILRTHPDVAEAIVSARPNPMTGNVLTALVALQVDADGDDITKRLRSWVRERAPRTHVPATIEITERIETSAAGKIVR